MTAPDLTCPRCGGPATGVTEERVPKVRRLCEPRDETREPGSRWRRYEPCGHVERAQQATDPTTGEVGLSEAERESVRTGWVTLDDLEAAVERILAARTADLRAERDAESDRLRTALHSWQDRSDGQRRRAEAAEAEAANLQADYDRRGERLWRLAALTGYVPSESDNDATAELVLSDALAEAAKLRATVERVEALANEWEADYPSSLASCNREVDEWWIDLRAALTAHRHDEEGGSDG